MGIQKDKLSEEQKKEVERLRQFAARNRLTPQMNSTKWRAAIDAITALEGYRPSFRLRSLGDREDPTADRWDEGFPGNVPLYNSIHWLELNRWNPAPTGKAKRQDFAEALATALRAAGAPIETTPMGIRIIAYIRT